MEERRADLQRAEEKESAEVSSEKVRALFIDLYNYFRMDSGVDPIVLFEQLCCLLIQLSDDGLEFDGQSGHQRQKGLEGSAADRPVRWRSGDRFLWPVTSRERPSPTVAAADPRRPKHTKRDGRRPLRREPRDKWLRRDAVSHRIRVFAAQRRGAASP